MGSPLLARFHTSPEPQRKGLDCFRPLLKPALPVLGSGWGGRSSGPQTSPCTAQSSRKQRIGANCRGWRGVKGGPGVISRAGIEPGQGGLRRQTEGGCVCICTVLPVSVGSSSWPSVQALSCWGFPAAPELPRSLAFLERRELWAPEPSFLLPGMEAAASLWSPLHNTEPTAQCTIDGQKDLLKSLR